MHDKMFKHPDISSWRLWCFETVSSERGWWSVTFYMKADGPGVALACQSRVTEEPQTRNMVSQPVSKKKNFEK